MMKNVSTFICFDEVDYESTFTFLLINILDWMRYND